MTSTDLPVSPTDTAHPASSVTGEPTVNRRMLLRGGAIAAGATVIGAAALPTASAANGEPVLLGGSALAATATTNITLNGTSGSPSLSTLKLTNVNGPSLTLNALAQDWEGELGVGQIANTTAGPLVGIDGGGGSRFTTYLATGVDLDNLPLPVPVNPPKRVLDTRSGAGRTGIVRTSGSALDSSNRLKAGSWIDVAVEDASGDVTLDAAFLNVTVTGPLTGGYLAVYPPGTRPNASSVTFSKGVATANAAFVGVGYFGGAFVVRIYASAVTHVIADLTGATIRVVPGPAAAPALRAKTPQSRRTPPSMVRATRSLSRGQR